MGEQTSQRWIDVQVRVPGGLVSPVRELLQDYVRTPASVVKEKNEDLWLVTGALPDSADAGEKIARFHQALEVLEKHQKLSEPLFVDLKVVEGDEANPYHRRENPIFVGKRFVILPAGYPAVPVPGRTSLFITAMHAFGDGKHPSTTLALRLLAKVLEGVLGGVPDKGWVLDAGCGTGILSFAVSALAGCHVLAVDISEEAMISAQANQKENGQVGSRVRFVRGGFACCRGPFSLILANLVASVHAGAHDSLWKGAAPGGWFILAGFSSTQRELVLKPYLENGAEEKARLEMDGWLGVVLRKP
jgi:ribosomal protein L11 methyltransferase